MTAAALEANKVLNSVTLNTKQKESKTLSFELSTLRKTERKSSLLQIQTNTELPETALLKMAT